MTAARHGGVPCKLLPIRLVVVPVDDLPLGARRAKECYFIT